MFGFGNKTRPAVAVLSAKGQSLRNEEESQRSQAAYLARAAAEANEASVVASTKAEAVEQATAILAAAGVDD